MFIFCADAARTTPRTGQVRSSPGQRGRRHVSGTGKRQGLTSRRQQGLEARGIAVGKPVLRRRIPGNPLYIYIPVQVYSRALTFILWGTVVDTRTYDQNNLRKKS